MVADHNLNTVCERLEEHCLDDLPAVKRHTNTGAKLWGRVRSKLLRQKVFTLFHLALVSFFLSLFFSGFVSTSSLSL